VVCVVLDGVLDAALMARRRGDGILACMRVLCLGAGDVITVTFASSQLHSESLLRDNAMPPPPMPPVAAAGAAAAAAEAAGHRAASAMKAPSTSKGPLILGPGWRLLFLEMFLQRGEAFAVLLG
jgi:hypothetical protein